MGAPSPRYTAEFKQEAVELYKKSGTAYAEVARGLGCDAGACPTGSRRPTRPIADGRRPVPDGRGPAQVQRRRPQHGAVRRHHLREDPAGPAAPGAGDGHIVKADRRLGHLQGITAELADEALKMAPARRNNPKGCVHHSGHGAQYASLPPSKIVRERGARPSMGSISSPWGNAAMESLMGIVKSECVHARACATREEAALDTFEYIEAVHNRARTHSALGHMSPAESEEANWPDGEGRPKAA